MWVKRYCLPLLLFTYIHLVSAIKDFLLSQQYSLYMYSLDNGKSWHVLQHRPAPSPPSSPFLTHSPSPLPFNLPLSCHWWFKQTWRGIPYNISLAQNSLLYRQMHFWNLKCKRFLLVNAHWIQSKALHCPVLCRMSKLGSSLREDTGNCILWSEIHFRKCTTHLTDNSGE